MTHYIHRPTPEGGETDPRFRELTQDMLVDRVVEVWGTSYWHGSTCPADVGDIWRIPGSDAPSDELLALAKATRETT